MLEQPEVKLEGEMQDDGDFVIAISQHAAHVEKYILTVWHGQKQIVKLRGLSLRAFSISEKVAKAALDESEED